MRRSQKRQAEEFVKLLGRAHREIKKALEHKNRAVARDLLEQCQDGAIELGNMIEEEEGEGFATIPLVENYCEQLYQLHEKVWRRLPVNAGKECNVLENSLSQIKNSIRDDIREYLEVVLFPYKASMWDSMECVWKAAKADSGCNVYVVPIPFYDKNPDGSFREMYYEGENYPDDVPVLGYEEYDLAQRRPDVIFIQNPYDESDEKVSVHPFFYSSNLKRYTDILAYISEENCPDDKAIKEKSAAGTEEAWKDKIRILQNM